MVELILIFAILNVGLGYALAVSLADQPLAGLALWGSWRTWRWNLPRIRPGSQVEPAAETEPLPPAGMEQAEPALFAEDEPAEPLPPVAVVEELPAAWLDMLTSEQLSPRWFADGLVQALRLQLAAYRQQALAAESRARLALAEENGRAVEQLVADFRFLHHEWLAGLLAGAELMHERHGRLGSAEDSSQILEGLLYDHAAHMEWIDRSISEIDFQTDLELGCRRLLDILLELAAAVHRLRDDLAASLAAILRDQGMLADLPHEQRLDPLTGRLTRLGLEASFHPSAEPRQAVLVAWDNFHLVNERLGVRAGDRLLRTFNQLLTDLVAEGQASAEIIRLTGAQFLLLLDGISTEQAVSLAEQMRQSLEGVMLDWQGTTLELSARMGITAVVAEDTLRELLARLERALDAAELAGRNRCAIADGGETRIVAPHAVMVIARRVEVEDAGELAGPLQCGV